MWVLLVVVSVLAWTVVDSLRLMHCSSLCKARTTSSVRWHTTAMAALRNDNDRDDDSVKKTGGRGDGWKTLVRQFDDGASGNGRRSKAGGSSKYRASSSARRPTASSEMFPSGASSSSSSSGGSNSHSKVALVKRAVTSGVVPISAGGVPASKLAIAKALNIKDELQCSHFDTCSGCTIAGNFTSAGLMQRASKFFKLYNLQMKTHVDAVKHWRSHVKLAVQPMSKWGGMKIGLYHANSHTVEAIPHCQVHHPRINEAVELLRLTALDCGVKAYQEPANNRGRGNGELRYVQLSMERRSNKVQLVLVWNADHYKDCSQALGRLVKKLKSQPIWHSITINFNTGSSNVIFNYEEDGWKLLHGPSFIKERVGNATFLFRPQIFRQANLDAFESQIIPLIANSIPVGSKVSELYSGIGTIGLNVAKVSSEVFCSDSNEYVDEVFDDCVASLPEEDREKVYFDCMNADEAVQAGQCDAAEVVIMDPPRKGLSETVMNYFSNTLEDKPLPKELRRLIYVGCGFDAVERDTRLLVESGLWKVKSADGFVLFPGTDHIETVVVFDRTRKL